MATAELLLTDVDFVTIPTNDFERALAFYGETPGLPRTSYGKRGFAGLESRGVEFKGDILDSGVCHMTWRSSQTSMAMR